MGAAGKLAKKAAKAAGKKAGNAALEAARRRNPAYCPGSHNGRHSYKTEVVGGHPVTYCKNDGCGRVGK